MSGWKSWLLDALTPAGRPTGAAAAEVAHFGWRTPLPAWVWACIVLAAIVVAIWSYRGRIGRRWVRVLLAGVRASTMVLLAALLAGPQRVEPHERVAPDRVYLLIDRSASMLTGDGPIAESGVRLSRDEHLRRLLSDAAPMLTGSPFRDDRHVLAFTFAQDLTPLKLAALTDPPAAEGGATQIESALRAVLGQAVGAPVAGIMLLSDGRTARDVSPALLRELEQRGIGVYAAAFGQRQPPPDLAIHRIEAPSRAFLSDRVPVTVWLSQDDEGPSPRAADDRAGPFTLRLVDAATRRVLDERELTADDLQQPQRLEGRGELAGPMNWRVELDAPYSLGELTTENNHARVAVELVDRPLRVLYVDGQPRWTYRYLKNFLVRTEGIEASVLLVSAESGFVQEGARALARFPQDVAELAPYDVLVIGDVPPTYFGPGAMRLIRDQVATRGLGLLWIGGPRFTPAAYADTSLDELLPMRRPGQAQTLTDPTRPVTLRRTPAAERVGILRLDGDPGDAQARAGAAIEAMPPLYYAQEIGDLKPAVDVLATGLLAAGEHDQADRTAAILTQMRYGSGLVMYLATDDLWRWRYGAGGLYDERLYAQLLQVLARHGMQRGSMSMVWLDVPHADLRAGQTTLVRLRVGDPLTAQALGPQVTVEVIDPGDAETSEDAGTLLEQVTLTRVGGPLSDARDAEAVYEGLWRPTEAGGDGPRVLRVAEPALAGLALSRRVNVAPAGDERRDLRADHALLDRLAQASGGIMLPADDPDQENVLMRLARMIPRRAQRHPIDRHSTLWDQPFVLATLLTLLTLEWAGRKALHMA